MSGKRLKDGDILKSCSNLYRLAEVLGLQERRIMDFSAPVNPLGVSKKVKSELRKQLKYLDNYPDPDARRLRKRLAQQHNIDPETILCGNGSTDLVYLIARTLKPPRVFIFMPASPEYERACRICRTPEVMYSGSLEEDDFQTDAHGYVATLERNFLRPEEDRKPDPAARGMIFLCNPNYPAGRLLKAGAVRRIAETAKKLECYLVVDEGFIDFCPGASTIKDVSGNPRLIVLRSMSPFYALSGLRIGYGVFHHNLIGQLKEHRGPWTVNSLAQRAALTAMKDKAYIKDSLRTMQEEKTFFEKNFRKLGIDFFPSAANFYLLKINNAEEISLRLKRKGILLADWSHFTGLDDTHLGVSVKSHRENALFLKEMAKALDRRPELQCLSSNG
jgi:threonine-phosphate decarboxylase